LVSVQNKCDGIGDYRAIITDAVKLQVGEFVVVGLLDKGVKISLMQLIGCQEHLIIANHPFLCPGKVQRCALFAAGEPDPHIGVSGCPESVQSDILAYREHQDAVAKHINHVEIVLVA